MKIGRTIPPAAAPPEWRDLWNALAGMFSPETSLQALEEAMRRHFGVSYLFLVSSGTAALTLTLTALKSCSSKTEVVIPAYTCFSVPAAVVKAGLRPVLCDINPSTFDFDHALLERTLTPNTLCVVAHHLFGVPSNIEQIRTICHTRRIVVVEDAAQAMGVRSKGRPLGTLGDVGIFSMGRGKNITCGSGGIIITSSAVIAEAVARCYRQLRAPTRLETLKEFFQLVLMTILIRPRLYWIPAALPFLHLGETTYPKVIPLGRLSGMKAALLRNWQRRLARSNHVRSETASYFNQRLPLRLPAGPSHPYLRLPILLNTPRDKHRLHLQSRAHGLGLAAAYPTPVNEIPEVRFAGSLNGQRFPQARRVADTLLTIPTHGLLSEKDKRAITELCRNANLECTENLAPAVRLTPDATAFERQRSA